MKGNNLIIFLLCILITFAAEGQRKSKTDLQKEKQEQLKKINEVEKILGQTTSEKKNTLGELNALNQRIKVQEGLISSMRGELNYINQELSDKNEVVSSLEKDLQNLKQEYASMLYVAQKASYGHNMLTFLFSSTSFNQLMMRLEYIQQYGEARRKQAEQIQKVQGFLVSQTQELKVQQADKNKLLSEQIKQNTQLTSLKQKQSELVNNLQKEEKKLKADLEKTRLAVAKLDKLIEDLVKEEIAKAKAAETSVNTTVLSNSFAENKSKLPWPVSGFISQKFGKQNHPVLKNIVIENNGINIQTKKDESVKAIFSGTVRQVAFVPGLGNLVIIKHGDYFSVYAGMKDVYVKTGQEVLIKQDLGKVITNGDGISELRFEVRKNNAALNPEQWLSRN